MVRWTTQIWSRNRHCRVRWSGREQEPQRRFLKERIKEGEVFVERAGKRLHCSSRGSIEGSAQRVRRQEELEVGQLRTDCSRSFSSMPCAHSGGVSDHGAQIISLQQMVNLIAERDVHAERLQQHDVVAEPFGKKPDAGRFHGQHNGRVGAMDARSPTGRCLESAGW